ncbi:MAG: peptidoglycan DD-metalloendopeptidase family protein [Acidimicrobiia bacterium]|nr:peptidoglycan DD-metalloendopeptidase family protein [Acidimicrobiia bacterium]
MRKYFKYIVPLTICCAIISSQYIAYGTVEKSVAKHTTIISATDPRIQKLTADLEYATKAEAVEILKYATAKQARLDADAKLASLNSKIKAAQNARAIAIADQESAKAEYADSQLKYDTSIKESDDAKNQRDRAIIDLYIQSSDPDFIPSVLDVPINERQDVVRKTILRFRYTDQKIETIKVSAIKADEAVAEKALHIDALMRAEASKQEADRQEAALIPLKADLANAQADAKEKEAIEQKAVNAIKSQKSSYTSQINQIKADSDALAAQIKRKQNQIITPTPVIPGRMIHPVSGSINSSFGYRTHPIYGDARLHAGIDFNAGVGTPIKAAKAGTVISASVMSGYGNVIVIDHGGGISTLYAHQSSFAVSAGTYVTQGQIIGYSGMSGNVTGPHLHFEVRVNGTPTDPMAYL